jgi:hypothetical protein
MRRHDDEPMSRRESNRRASGVTQYGTGFDRA